MAISLTESAAERVRRHIAERGRGVGLRLGIKSSGCSGFSYVVDYADAVGSEDLVFDSRRSVKVVVDRSQLAAVDGTQIDFVRQGVNENFRFDNPNVRVRAQCGCGESFSV